MTEEQFRQANEDLPLTRRVLHDLGFFGHYLHVHAGGRSGKQHILVRLLQDGAVTQRELLDKTCISSAALSEVLSKLEGEGLIQRSKSAADQRTLVVELTDAGHARACELLASRERFEELSLACLDEREQKDLLEMLDRLAEHWQSLDVEGGDAR